jgi:hypothetical protein
MLRAHGLAGCVAACVAGGWDVLVLGPRDAAHAALAQ